MVTRAMGIELVPMRHLSEVSYEFLSNCCFVKLHTKLLQVKDYGQDDWTDLSDLQARRKRQNRLSKRAQHECSTPKYLEEWSLMLGTC
jgi:hypothetical protein